MRLVGFMVAAVVLSSAWAGLGLVEATSSASLQESELSGLLVDMPAGLESDALQNAQETLDRLGFETPTEVKVLYTQDGTYFIAFTEDPGSGEVTIRGRVVEPQSWGRSTPLVIPSEVSVSQDARKVPFEDLQSNQSQFAGELVEVRTFLSELPTEVEYQGVFGQQTIAVLSPDSDQSTLITPGRQSRRVVIDASNRLNNSESGFLLVPDTRFEFQGDEDITAFSWQRQTWYTESESRVKIAVLPTEDPTPLVIDVTPVANTRVSVGTLQRNGAEYENEVVRVRGHMVGTSQSVRETLLTASRCSPDVLLVPPSPGSPPACIPALADTNVHSGVLVDDGDGIGFIGVDNSHQDAITKIEQGRFELTGRVVPAENTGFGVKAETDYLLVVYDRNRIGTTSQRLDEEAETLRQTLSETVFAQIALNQSEYSDRAQRVAVTPSPSPMPTATATRMQTTSVTPTPTSQPTMTTQASGTANLQIRNPQLGADRLSVDQSTRVSAEVVNTGSVPGTMEVRLEIGNQAVTDQVRVRPGERREVEFVWTSNRNGSFVASVNGQSVGEVRVGEVTTDTVESGDTGLDAFLAGVVILLLLTRAAFA